MAHSSLRFGIGRFTTEEEVDLAVALLEKHVKRCDGDTGPGSVLYIV